MTMARVNRSAGLIRLIAALILFFIATASLIPQVHADQPICGTAFVCLSDSNGQQDATGKAQRPECEPAGCHVLFAILIPHAALPPEERARFASLRNRPRPNRPFGACFRPPI